jgi:hypothetical protein
MGATQRNLKAHSKILKKLSQHQINQSERTLSQKKSIYIRATRRNSPQKPQKQ